MNYIEAETKEIDEIEVLDITPRWKRLELYREKAERERRAHARARRKLFFQKLYKGAGDFIGGFLVIAGLMVALLAVSSLEAIPFSAFMCGVLGVIVGILILGGMRA